VIYTSWVDSLAGDKIVLQNKASQIPHRKGVLLVFLKGVDDDSDLQFRKLRHGVVR